MLVSHVSCDALICSSGLLCMMCRPHMIEVYMHRGFLGFALLAARDRGFQVNGALSDARPPSEGPSGSYCAGIRSQ